MHHNVVYLLILDHQMRLLLNRLFMTFVLLGIGFASGTFFGFTEGFKAFPLMDAAPKGALAVSNLHALSEGKIEPTQLLFESDVDQSLSFYSYLSEQWWFGLYQHGWLMMEPDDQDFISRVANYRKTHPSLAKEDMFDSVPEGHEKDKSFYQDMAIQIREHLRRVDLMVKRYAQ